MTRQERKSKIEEIEQRAVKARVPMSRVCDQAGVLKQVWSRCKIRGAAHPITLDKMSVALDRIERNNAILPR